MVLKPFTFKIDDELKKQVELWSRKLNENKSVFIRKAIQLRILYLSKKIKVD